MGTPGNDPSVTKAGLDALNMQLEINCMTLIFAGSLIAVWMQKSDQIIGRVETVGVMKVKRRIYKVSYPDGRHYPTTDINVVPEKEWRASSKQDASSIIRSNLPYTAMGIALYRAVHFFMKSIAAACMQQCDIARSIYSRPLTKACHGRHIDIVLRTC